MPPASPDVPLRSSGDPPAQAVLRPPVTSPSRPAGHLELAARMRQVIGGQTFREVSDRTGANHETVRRYFLNGKPNIAFLAAFCSAYDIRADWLLTGIGSPRRESTEMHDGAAQPERSSSRPSRRPAAVASVAPTTESGLPVLSRTAARHG